MQMPNQKVQEILADIKRQRLNSVDQIVTHSKLHSASVIEAIFVLVESKGLSMAEAKEQVTNHPAWRSEAKAGDEFHQKLMSDFEKNKDTL